VIATEADNFAPAVAGQSLLWTRSVVTDAVVVVPSGGGDARILVDRAELPSWSPDGRHVAFITGAWRLADWALNLDAGIVDLDGDARAASKPRAFVAGYHEDFTPFWSPDGHWIATALTDGATTNIWTLSTADGAMKQITDFSGRSTGIARSMSWSTDSQHIYAAVAQQERELISRRTREALAAAKARGVKLGRQQTADDQKAAAAARDAALEPVLRLRGTG
jgi:Tol biopolymer transport system component